jgi:hypothetical protein
MIAVVEWLVLGLACFGTVLWCKRTDDRRQST